MGHGRSLPAAGAAGKGIGVSNLAQGSDRLCHRGTAIRIRRMAAKESIAGIWQTVKEGCPPQRIKSRALGDLGAKRVCFQLKPFGKTAGPYRGPDLLRLLNGGRIAAADSDKDASQQRALAGALLLLRDVAQDVMGGLMPHDKSDFIDVAGVGDQREVEGKDRAAVIIQGLIGVGGLIWAVINRDQEIAVQPTGAGAADLLGHGFDRSNGGDKVFCGL